MKPRTVAVFSLGPTGYPNRLGSAPLSTLDAQDRQPAPASLLRIAKLQELLAEIRASEQPDERPRNVDSNRSEKDALRLMGGARCIRTSGSRSLRLMAELGALPGPLELRSAKL
jgi:hypothetical protein